MRASLAGLLMVAWVGVAVSAPFNPSRREVITGTNAFPYSSIADAVVLDGDHLLARNRNDADIFVLQRHLGGADKWNVRAELQFAPGVGLTLSSSMALGGDVAVVGNTGDSTAAPTGGAVYVFLRNHPSSDAWGYWKTVTDPGAAAGDRLGVRVATDGRYLAVSALSTGAAAVQLFARQAGGADQWGWVKAIPLAAPQGNAAVALDGDLLAVGEYGSATNELVRLFERNAGGEENWGLIKTLTPTDGANSNRAFGIAMALDGDWLAVGASQDREAGGGNEGAVYVFHRHAGGLNQWGQVAKRLPDPSLAGTMGESVSLQGDTLVAAADLDPGARLLLGGSDGGALYVFQRNQGGSNAWGRTARLLADTNTATLGNSGFGGAGVALGDDVLLGATHSDGFAPLGGARVFQEYTCPDWKLLKRVAPSAGGTNAELGFAIALAESYLVGGRPGDNSVVNEGGHDVFLRNVGGADFWNHAFLVGGGGASATNARSASALAASPHHYVLGAPGLAGYGVVQVRPAPTDGTPSLLANLTSPDFQADEQFGTSVAIWDDVVLAGAPLNDTAAIGAGAAFIYSRNQGSADTWGLVKRLEPSPLPATADFGRSAALYRDIAAVGAPYESDFIDGMGAVYVFQANRGGSNNWGQVQRLKVPGIDVPYLGWSVALWGDVLAVGAVGDDAGAPNSGAVYLFERNRGGADNWGLIKKVKPPTPQDNAEFGWSVALRGDRLVVGEPRRDADFADQGRAFVFERNQDGADQWGFVTRIDPPTPQLQAWFGASVALINDRIAVGAPYEDSGTATNAGAVYLFQPDCLRITTTNDVVSPGDSLTSLRETIILANASTQATFTVRIPDGVFVSPGFTPLFVTNTTTQIILQGQGARRTVIDKVGGGRAFELFPGTTGEIRDLTIKNGKAPTAADGMGSTNGGLGGSGGGLFSYGDWSLIRCAIVSNTAGNGGNAQVGQGTQVGYGGGGGGIYVGQGRMTIRDCTITHNRAGDAGATGDVGAPGGSGGGVHAVASTELRIFNSTVFGNTAGQGSASASDGDGGGVHSFGDVTIRHSTISHNSAGSGANRDLGGGVYVSEPATLRFSILNNNTGAAAAPDAYGEFVSPTYNLITDTNGVTFTGTPVSNIVGVLALLGGAEVVNNGGPTDTMLPQPGSPVIDKGDATLANLLAKDQRGYLRPTNGISIDLGAVETTTDLDGDGVPDEWELARGTDREEPADGAADLDGDGLSGVQEYIMDANPYASDPLAVVQIVQTGLTAAIQFPSSPVRLYSLQTTLSLTSGDWGPVSSQQDVPGNGGLLTLIHTNAVPARGYRVVVELP